MVLPHLFLSNLTPASFFSVPFKVFFNEIFLYLITNTKCPLI